MFVQYQSDVVAGSSGYQITLNRTGTQAPVLLVTFDIIGSRIGKTGFGTAQALKNGADNLYVSQQWKTSYQELSQEAFFAATRHIFANYDRVLFYGHSLGGYAVLYFSQQQKADVFSMCPRCPAHPMFDQLRSPRKPPKVFRHGPVTKTPGCFWTVLWDPSHHDNVYIEQHVGLGNIDREIRIPDLGHDLAPKVLTLNGSLQTYVSDWICQRPVSVLPSFAEGTNFAAMITQAKHLVKMGHYGQAVELLERSLSLAETSNARKVLARAMEGMQAASAALPVGAAPVDIPAEAG